MTVRTRVSLKLASLRRTVPLRVHLLDEAPNSVPTWLVQFKLEISLAPMESGAITSIAVDLTENERCDIYEEGLDVLLLTTAIKHTGWREAKTLKDKQDLARSAAYIQHKLAQLEPETQNPELQKDQTPEELPNQSI
ncbi:hypothetical protein H4Q26_014092 [Puccinia striiformis f. sp. tritici PST-130]|nr:hypothetical protein H4Q26_014092 [Puccinia striiformis f. sp. tritici PST-130]